MEKKLTSIKVTTETARNIKGAAYLTNKKQYEAAESASEMYLSFIESELNKLDKKKQLKNK